jgi:hypothetical protein
VIRNCTAKMNTAVALLHFSALCAVALCTMQNVYILHNEKRVYWWLVTWLDLTSIFSFRLRLEKIMSSRTCLTFFRLFSEHFIPHNKQNWYNSASNIILPVFSEQSGLSLSAASLDESQGRSCGFHFADFIIPFSEGVRF